MSKYLITERTFLIYIAKFFLAYGIFYYGSLALVGLSVSGGYYSSFVDHYIDIATWLRDSLLFGSKLLVSIFGYSSFIENAYSLKMESGRSVHIVFSCLGFGVMSFWSAFIIANKGRTLLKIIWILSGLFIIWLINILRISLLLLAVNKKMAMPFGLDNHTLFNIMAYSAILLLIYFFDKSQKKLDIKNTTR